MTIARKIKFTAFYLYLKLLRSGHPSQMLGSLEQRFYAQLCRAQNRQVAGEISARNAFWIKGSFNEGFIAPQLDALVVSRQLKFGNAILQLTNAIQLARQLGVRKIYHRGYIFLRIGRAHV